MFKQLLHAQKLWLAVQIRSFALVFVDGVMEVGLMAVFRQLFQILAHLCFSPLTVWWQWAIWLSLGRQYKVFSNAHSPSLHLIILPIHLTPLLPTLAFHTLKSSCTRPIMSSTQPLHRPGIERPLIVLSLGQLISFEIPATCIDIPKQMPAVSALYPLSAWCGA